MKFELSERQIEDIIFTEQVLKEYNITCIARQVSSIPYENSNGKHQHCLGGIVDIIGYHHPSKSWVIIELKKGVIDSHAYCQLARYMNHAKSISVNYWCGRRGREPRFFGLLIGTGITDEVGFIDCMCDARDMFRPDSGNPVFGAVYKTQTSVVL